MTFRRYPATYNPILEYWAKIESGEEPACAKIRKLYAHLADKIRNPGEYHYSPARANHVIEFAENYCRHSKGKYGGQMVRLELWEKALLAAAFGFIDDDGLRQYQAVLLIVAKKNGKSLIASIVGNYMLTADGEAGPEVYAVATKRDQAKIIWNEAKRMIKKSPSLSKRIRSLVGELAFDENDGTFKPLASDSNSLDGLNVHCALMDEIHQWQNGRALYDIIADGVTAREQPMIFMTSTAGVIREDIYDFKYDEAEAVINGWNDPEGYHDERFLPVVYELDKREEWTDPKCWKKANPGLGTIKNIRTLAEKVERAKANPDLVKNLVCKEFNIRETTSESWLTFEELNNTDTFRLDFEAKRMIWTHDGEERILSYPRYGIGGADLSQTTDLTCATVLFAVPEAPGYLFRLSMYFLPSEVLDKHVKEDHVPYDKWLDRGLLTVCEGGKVHKDAVTDWFRKVREELDIYVLWCGYDSWSAQYWVEDMKMLLGGESMIAVHQGKKTLSNPMGVMGSEIRAKRIVYNNNPIDKWCLANTAIEQDKNGNIQPHKTTRATKRIDGTAAMLDAFVVYSDKQNDYMNLI